MKGKRAISLTAEPAATWQVLLLGGSSGTGKSTLAPQIARHFGASWLEADDIRLALQRATTPTTHPALHFFLTDDMAVRADFWELPPEAFRDGLIAVGQVVSAALAVVVANHVAQQRPVVLEGDGILPAQAAQLAASSHGARAIFLFEPDLEAVLATMRTRPWVPSPPEPALRTYARANWLYGLWLREEAARHGLPVLEVRPYETLLARALPALMSTTP